MSKVQFKPRKETKYIFVHCSATRPSQDVGVREIRQWHKEQGWLDVGYHFVIKRDGTIETGRSLEAVGSHVKGYNEVSVGICLVGGIDDQGKPNANFTDSQMESLKAVLKEVGETYPEATILGHHSVANKACPCFHVAHWLETYEVITATTE